MSLRTTRQYIEVLLTGSDGTLRTTRQYVEVLAAQNLSPSPSPSPSLSLSPSMSPSPSPSPSLLSPSPSISPSPLEIEPLRTTDAFLRDLMTRRGVATVSGNPNRFGIELAGGHVVEMTPFEPDAATYRNWYYYNTASNLLMRKIIVSRSPILVAYWKQVSN